MPDRSTQVYLVNGTSYTITRLDQGISHGAWNGGPVETIQPHTMRCIAQTDSDGTATGDEAWVLYNISDKNGPQGTMRLKWDNPFYGDNVYGCSTTLPGGYMTWAGGGGNNAVVAFIFCIATLVKD